MLSVSVLVAFVDEAFAVAMVSCSLKNQPELSGWSRDILGGFDPEFLYRALRPDSSVAFIAGIAPENFLHSVETRFQTNRMKHKTKEVGLSEARTHRSALVARVQRGEEITITKHRVPVARLVPAGASARRDPKDAAARIRALRRGLALGEVGLRSLIEEGRL